MRQLVPALAALLLLAAPAHAAWAEAPDDGLGASLHGLRASLAYFDANGNGRADAANPAEPVYLDLDNSRSVSYGDVRLTALGPAPAIADIDLLAPDLTRTLAAAPGWFATDGDGTWWADLDNTLTLTTGDVRVADGVQAAATAGLGARLTGLADSSRVGSVYVTADAGDRRDPGEAMALDLDSSNTLSRADLQLAPPAPAAAAGEPSAVAKATAGWRPLDYVVLGVALLNLAGLAFVLTRPAPPHRNPFK